MFIDNDNLTNFRDQFPIFTNNPDLVYLDSASTTQKLKYVIDKTSEYITTSYANVGRGSYDLAEKSDYYYY
ncbi:aminotransferase class V-fold PLP-dependent enzyme [Patescibacteria group bacterium]|nr:aminotransferase class V-fold PLP-dependent enzyme [Patescibacteria group bacterium]